MKCLLSKNRLILDIRLCLAFTAKNRMNLMSNHILNSSTCRCKILTRIKVRRVIVEILTDCSGHRKTDVGINVDLADRHFGSLTKHLFRNTDCIRHISAVIVIILTNSGTTEDAP